MRTALSYSSLIIYFILVVLVFITSKSYTQLGLAALLYPLFVFFAFKLFFKDDNDHKSDLSVPLSPQAVPGVTASNPSNNATTIIYKEDEGGIIDNNKRDFLKMIGAAGISLFIFSLFGGKIGQIFGGRGIGSGIPALDNITGNKTGQGTVQPTEGYQITEIDDSFVSFYGFTNHDGAWFIMKEDTDTGAFRYSKGDSDFSGNWSNRENLSYDYYYNTF